MDSKESIPPAYVAWRASTTNRVVVLASQAGNRFLASLKSLQIRALAGWYDNPIPTRFLAPIDCLKIPALITKEVADLEQTSPRKSFSCTGVQMPEYKCCFPGKGFSPDNLLPSKPDKFMHSNSAGFRERYMVFLTLCMMS
jgi:hypothetical protein